ncbi:Alpha/Beta hydrolase protein [Mycena epipterygia]|nr:Alpha/Beta hydrolase protein [Mycena epipterygia]
MTSWIDPFLMGLLRPFALMWYGQRMLTYPSAFRPSEMFRTPDMPPQSLKYSDVEITTSDKVLLRCWMIRREEQGASNLKKDLSWKRRSHPEARFDIPTATVIMFHGNGMCCSDLLTVARSFVFLGCNVLMVSYRGYGNSEGIPSEKGLRRDAQAALDYVKADAELAKTPIIPYGLSLGGAVAIDLARRNPSGISALIVENTFESIPRVVRDWPIVGPFSFICTQRWNSAAKVPHIPATTPILMLSGERDEIVPRKHMQNLWKLSQKRGGKKTPVSDKDRFASIPSGHHRPQYVAALHAECSREAALAYLIVHCDAREALRPMVFHVARKLEPRRLHVVFPAPH